MRVMQLPAFGLDRLEIVEQPDPQPGPGEVLVRLEAASLNSRDVQIISGAFSPDADLPLVPCSDGAGRVVATGEGVTALREGDLVCPLFFPNWQSGEALAEERAISSGLETPGTLREFGVYPEAALIRVPDSLSAAEAACLPCAGVTAWSCVHALADVGPGDWVLAQGTGGVSLFAMQFARALGAKVIVSSSSDTKLERAAALGADALINYAEHPDWGERVRDIADGQGVACIAEIGGEGTLPQSVAALRRGGHIGIVGYFAGIGLGLSVFDLIERNAHVHGISVGNRGAFQSMLDCIAANEIHPVIDQHYGLEEAPLALADLGKAAHFGKLVIDL